MKWADAIGLELAESAQDMTQHWLFVPPGDPPANEDYKDLFVAYTFLFSSAEALDAFKQQFVPTNAYTPDIEVFFPEELTPLSFTDPERLLVVGFSKLGNLQNLYVSVTRNEWGGFYVTGLPLPNSDFSAIGAGFGSVETDENIVAIVDTDIGFANARFRESVTKTRIKAYWDQDARFGPAFPLFLGQQMLGVEIDALLVKFNQDGNVNEHALYAKYYSDKYDDDAFPRLPIRQGHGTHVLDVMAGGKELGASILAVDLRSQAVDATQGSFLFPWVVMALIWIARLSGQEKLPQINFSFGGLAGRHDGQDPMELVFDWFLAKPYASVLTIPAGNFYDTETHASFCGSDLTASKTLGWMVQPDDGTSNILEVWLPTCDKEDAQIRVTLTAPNGLSETFTDADFGENGAGTYRDLLDGDKLLARVYVECVSVFGATPRARIGLYLRHTAIDRDYFQFQGGCPELAGRWEIRLEQLSLADDERVELWVERDDTLGRAGNGARQSYFDAPRPVWPERQPVPVYVRNDGTTSDIATGARTIVAAGSVRNSRQPAVYSSESFDCPVAFPPTAAATCDDSRVHGGILASGFFSESVLAMNGTSAASAVAAHVVGKQIKAGQGVTRPDIKDLAKADDGRTIPPSAQINPLFKTYDPVPPETRIGGGCLKTGWTRLPRFDE